MKYFFIFRFNIFSILVREKYARDEILNQWSQLQVAKCTRGEIPMQFEHIYKKTFIIIINY